MNWFKNMFGSVISLYLPPPKQAPRYLSTPLCVMVSIEYSKIVDMGPMATKSSFCLGSKLSALICAWCFQIGECSFSKRSTRSSPWSARVSACSTLDFLSSQTQIFPSRDPVTRRFEPTPEILTTDVMTSVCSCAEWENVLSVNVFIKKPVADNTYVGISKFAARTWYFSYENLNWGNPIKFGVAHPLTRTYFDYVL